MSPNTPQSKKELLEVQAQVFLYAPDHFVEHSWLPPDGQITFESCFDWLRDGVKHVYCKPRHEPAQKRMLELLEQSYAEYKAGRADEGRVRIGEFENLVIDTKP
jgi:hypothetical protein